MMSKARKNATAERVIRLKARIESLKGAGRYLLNAIDELRAEGESIPERLDEAEDVLIAEIERKDVP